MHALNDRLTEDQISELVGIDLYNDFVMNKLTEVSQSRGVFAHFPII
jgi:hypothetical protein